MSEHFHLFPIIFQRDFFLAIWSLDVNLITLLCICVGYMSTYSHVCFIVLCVFICMFIFWTEVSRTSCAVFSMSWYLGLFFLSCSTLYSPLMNFKRILLRHFSWMASWLSDVLTTHSFVIALEVCSAPSFRLLMKMMLKRTGPSMDLWGTLLITGL